MTTWVHTAIRSQLLRAQVSLASSLLACGGSGPSAPPPNNAGPPAVLVTPAAGADDIAVAKVGDRTVWGSCVADQVKRGALDGHPKTPRQALDECIDFELLARAAEARGLATDPTVIDATRTALVRRTIEVWQAAHATPDAMRPQIDELFNKAGPADIDKPELRTSWNLLVKVDKPEQDSAAKAYADAVYAALPATRGLFPADLEDALKAVPNPAKLVIDAGPFKPISKDNPGVVAPYRGALFALSEVGQVTPVTRSQFGYHVILMTDLEAGKHVEYKDAEPLLFDITRASAWRTYIEGLVAQHAVEKHYDRLASPSSSSGGS